MNTTVDFTMGAAIRTCDGDYQCPDEDAGCPGTKWVLCTFDVASDISQKIDFIGCWDGKSGEDWEGKARTCAAAGSLDFSKISACASGSPGAQLLKGASDAWNKNFPDKPCGGIFGVPHLEVNGKVQASTKYDDLLKNICATGISAAACKTKIMV